MKKIFAFTFSLLVVVIYKWSGVHNKFIMPMDIFVNKERNRIYPSLQFQGINITKHSLIEVLDKEFYIKKSLVPEESQL